MKPARLIFITLLLGFAPTAQAQFVWPTSGLIGSSYYTDRGTFLHHAIDINTNPGRTVIASYDGKVLLAGRYSACDFYGNLVALRHASGYDTYYGHNSRISVRRGQAVSQGQKISEIGNTGNAATYHCHFEIRRYNSSIYSYRYQIYVPGHAGMRTTEGKPVPHTYPGLDAAGAVQARRIDIATLNVREGAGTSRRVIGVARKGQVYVQFASDSGWSRIWFGGITGWVRTADTAPAKNAATRKVIVQEAVVRDGASLGAKELGGVRKDQIYVRIAGEGDFAKIFYRGGTGWVKTAALKIVKLD